MSVREWNISAITMLTSSFPCLTCRIYRQRSLHSGLILAAIDAIDAIDKYVSSRLANQINTPTNNQPNYLYLYLTTRPADMAPAMTTIIPMTAILDKLVSSATVTGNEANVANCGLLDFVLMIT